MNRMPSRFCPNECPNSGKRSDKCKYGHGGSGLCPETCPTNALKAKSECRSGHGGSSFCPDSCPTNAGKRKKMCLSGHGGSALCPETCPTNARKRKTMCLSGHGGSAVCPVSCPTNPLKRKVFCKSGHGGCNLCPVSCPTNALKRKSKCLSGHGGKDLCPSSCPTNAFKRRGYCQSGHGGFSVCPKSCTNAGKSKYYCPTHNGSLLCIGCHFTIVRSKGSMCKGCAPVARRQARTREARMAATLDEWAKKENIPKYSNWNKQNPLADPAQCGRYRVDFVFQNDLGVVLLEYDEQMHADRSLRCELVRQAEVTLGYGGFPVHWIRFNPDAFLVDGITRVTKRGEREAELLKQLRQALGYADYEHPIVVTYICYDKGQAGKKSIVVEEDASSRENQLVQTYKFKTIEVYSQWVESIS